MRAVSNRARPGTMLAVEFEELEGSTNGRSLATTGRPAALLRRTLDGSSWPARPSDHRQLPGTGIQWQQFGGELVGISECSVP